MPGSHRFCLNCGSDTTREPAKDPLLGQTLVGKYLIQESIGSGAMGTIYKAEQTALGKTVVIKVLHKHLLSDPELIQRFHREARAASRLNHPNCVQIMDFGTLEDGALYISMEYIHGIDLATLLEREYPVDHRRLISIMKQVMMALDEAHANGVLHRDLKPENIMIEDRRTAKDHVKVVDFGIAKLEENNPNSKRSFQTRTGIVCGTPEYMSPEQARGQKLDARSDLYAIGVMLYHMVTDRLPFEAGSPIEVVTKHISEPPVPPRMYRDDLPEALDRL
ncbi:MAG TPA: serine/threonine-protein kinase, partial [Myxococcota bacterium]|nr:serine/threonine-protein kinase [Myxococcota bacterium]